MFARWRLCVRLAFLNCKPTNRANPFMNNLTVSQINHRAFIASPLWAEIRKKAFEQHGHLCQKCGVYGGDVHHKTYIRFGGQELSEDLQILCRDCHEGFHQVQRALNPESRRKRKPWISTVVAFRYLTHSQKIKIAECQHVRLEDLLQLHRTHKGIMLQMRRLLGVNIIEARRKTYQRLLRRH